MRVFSPTLAWMALLLSCTPPPAPPVSPPAGKWIEAGRPVPESYIVVLREGHPGALSLAEAPDRASVAAIADAKARAHDAVIRRVYTHALTGFAATMSEAQAMALAADPDVAFVQEDGEVRAFGSQQSPPWGLDRIDQLTGLNQTYRFAAVGQGVHVYVIDTGIRVTHQDFEGRASEEFSSIDDGWGASDCNGHGTHVAGTIGGAVSGVAKGVRLHGVRVLDCYGRGSDSQVLAGIDWVTEHHQKPAVANMSLGGDVSPALDIAVARSVAAGVTHVVAAGNDSADACGYSPARESSAITVGATAPPTDFGDELAWFSNHGRCVDLLAPGQYIASADARNDTDFIEHSGTSMASPHVAGAAALYLGLLPTANPGDVAQALVGAASPVAMPLPIFTPPLLLYTGFLPPEAGAPPTVVLRAPAPGAVLAGDVMLAAEAGVGSTLARVEFRVDGSSAGVDRLSPFELRWDSTLVPNGRHRIEAVGFDALWRPSNAAFADVQVMNVGRADRDPVFATPSCRSVGSRCFAGALIAGRGLTEPGSPNTIGGRCGDGISGKWLLGSSIEGIDVSTEGGGPLAPGERAIVRAKWLANSSADAIDFFTADDAERPEWTLRGTANAPGAGAATTSFNHILPAGDWQAVRLVYRSEYRTDPTALTHAPCSLDLYDDRDDLVFAVGDGVPDAVPPVVIVTGPSEAIAAAAAFLQAEATDDRVVRRVAFEVDDKLVGDDLAPPWEVAWLPPKAGDFSIVARAWDAAGNEGVGAPFVVHVRDLSPPSVKLNAPAAYSFGAVRAYLRGDVPLAATASDANGGVVARVEFLVDGALIASDAVAPYEATLATDALAEGVHALGVRAVDDAGNSTQLAFELFVDRTPPIVAIASPGANAVVSGSVSVVVTAQDAGPLGGVTLLADGTQVNASYYSPITLSWDAKSAAFGSHLLTARVADVAGNVGEASVTVRVADLVPPQVFLNVSPAAPGPVIGRSADAWASGRDNVGIARTELRLDGLLVAASTGDSDAVFRWDATGAEGRHELVARTVDRAGNTQSTSLVVQVDATPPAVTLVSPLAGTRVEGTVSIEALVSNAEDLASLALLVDGRVVSTTAAPFQISWDTRFMPGGPHELLLRARDAVGNEATSPAVAVDVFAPEAAVYDGALGVPRCAEVGPACRAGYLIAGSAGNELHTPNVLGGTCGDDPWGSASVQAIDVATVDGSNLAVGRTVRVRARLLSFTGDVVDVYAAANALQPAWRHIASQIAKFGSQEIEVTFPLPPGSTQAVRVGLGSTYSAPSVCRDFGDDRDDLVFAVAP